MPISTNRLLIALALLAPAVCSAQAHADVVYGRVSTDNGAALPRATVVITAAPTADVFTTISGEDGRYRIAVAAPTGEYVVSVTRIGYRPFHSRLYRSRPAGDSLELNAMLPAIVQELTAVRVTARRSRPTPSLGVDGRPSTDGTDKTLDGVRGTLPPLLEGDIDAMTAWIPGITPVSGGVTALGLNPMSNLTTLNGMTFGGSAIPQDARFAARFAVSPWDPTRGGAAGILRSISLARGSNVSHRRSHVSFDLSGLQLADSIAAQDGQTVNAIQTSFGGDGALSLDRWFYNYGVQFSHRTAAAPSILTPHAPLLALSGLDPDSVARFLDILRLRQVPLGNEINSTAQTNSISLIERLDGPALTRPKGTVPGAMWSLTGFGQYSATSASDMSLSALPSYAADRSTGAVMLQGGLTMYLGANGDYVNETTSAVSMTSARTSPYSTMPTGLVTMASTPQIAGSNVGQAAFGGHDALLESTRAWAWELANQTSGLLAGRSTLPVKLYFQSRLAGFDDSRASDRAGTFQYSSLTDLENNTPSSFARTDPLPSRRDAEWTGTAALAGGWSTSQVDFTGGMRIDGNVWMDAPRSNPAVANTFGLVNNAVPQSVAISPRLGFRWYYEAHRGGGGSSVTEISTLYRGGPQIRGGIGRFRDTPKPTLLEQTLSRTGLPSAAHSVACYGPATPVPDWQAYASGVGAPDGCAGNAAALIDSAPQVALFDPRYQPVDRWRASLGWTNTVKGQYLAVDATWDMGEHEPGTVDLNFAGQPQFQLANEADRPVFIPAASIESSSGVGSPVASRRVTSFSTVDERVSDLRARSRQITVYLIPSIPYRLGLLTLGYTYASAQSTSRGFDQSTAGDPRISEWSDSPYTPTHQIVAQAAHVFGSFLGISAALRANSGMHYTPLVAGDLNGDGLLNDRPFIFDPATTAGASLAGGLRSLLAFAPAEARHCLSQQIGSIVRPNSCTAPWSATTIASVFFLSPLPLTQQRATVTLSLSNPLGGLDQLLHGAKGLRGWGMTPLPDELLYQVTGFDPVRRQFVYAVNQHFGRSDPSSSLNRTPFRISVSVSVDLGRSEQAQSLALNLRVKPALKNSRAPADSIKQRYLRMRSSNGFMDIYGWLLSRFADSLALSRAQVSTMMSYREGLRAKADSVFGALAVALAALPTNYDERHAVERANEASAAVWQIVYAERGHLLNLLTPAQVRRLPMELYQMVTEPQYDGRFYYSY